MNEIEFSGGQIVLREEVEAFGERTIEELILDNDELGEYELDVDTNGFVSMDALFDVEHSDEGEIQSLSIRFDILPSSQVQMRRSSRESNDELPPVPEIDVEDIGVQARRRFYERLRDSPDSQPGQIRRLVHEHGEVSRREFDRLVDGLGFTPEGGGTNMSLVVLEKVTEEIERRGRGEDQTIHWKG